MNHFSNGQTSSPDFSIENFLAAAHRLRADTRPSPIMVFPGNVAELRAAMSKAGMMFIDPSGKVSGFEGSLTCMGLEVVEEDGYVCVGAPQDFRNLEAKGMGLSGLLKLQLAWQRLNGQGP